MTRHAFLPCMWVLGLMFQPANASFFFGMLQGLSSEVSFVTFLGTIALLLFLEFCLGFLDYVLKTKAIYLLMLKRIYAELTVMGIMSFGIVMIEATGANNNSSVYMYVLGIDCAHYLLFFTVIFFVCHSFFLMYVSHKSAAVYLSRERMAASDLYAKIEEMSPLWRFLYNLRYFPFSFERQACEYKIMERIFKDTYWLPEEFDFASYLTHSFEHHALRTMDIGLYNWIILIMLVIFNYIRTIANLGFNCGDGDAKYAADLIGSVSGEPVEEYKHRSSSSDHRMLAAELVFDSRCTRFQLYLMFICAMLVLLFALVVLLMARYYELKLLSRAGIRNAADSIEFLGLIVKQDEAKENLEARKKKKHSRIEEEELTPRMSIAELKASIDLVLNELEIGDDSEGETWVYHWLTEKFKQLEHFVEDTYANFVEYVTSIISQKDSGSANKIQEMLRKQAHSNEHHTTERRNSMSTLTMQLKQRRNVTEVAHTHRGSRDRTVSWESPQSDSSSRQVRRDSHESVDGGGSTKSVGSMKSEIDSAIEFAKVSLVETFLKKKVTEDRALARAKAEAEAVAVANSARRSALERNGTASSSTTTIRVVPEGSAVVQGQPHSHSSSSVRPAEFAQDGTAIEEKLSEQANSAGGATAAAAAALALKEKEESEAEVEVHLSEDFKDIFLFGRPKIFFFTVNVTIMFCCFYLAVWATNYISMIINYNDSPALWQIILIFPMVIAFQLLAAINKSVALISAVCTLNLNLTLQVANETLEMDQAMAEMKDHTLLRIVEIFNEIDTLDKKLEVVDALFDSIDKDGSGEIDQFEFRGLLRNLSLHYSDERYRKLYRAIDSDGGGTIGKSEYFSLLFPYDEYTELRNEDSHTKEMKEKLLKDKAHEEMKSIGFGLLGGARRVSSVGLNAFSRINAHNPNVAHPSPVAGTPAALLRQRSMQVSFKDEVEKEPSRRASAGTLSYSLKSAPIKGENKASRLTLPEDGEEDDSLNEDEGDEDGLVPRVAVKKNAGETPVPLEGAGAQEQEQEQEQE